jgi:hypothetical protein
MKEENDLILPASFLRAVSSVASEGQETELLLPSLVKFKSNP